MRIMFQDNKIFMSFTGEDRKQIAEANTMPMQISLGQFRSLLRDINNVELEVWKKIDVPLELRKR